MLLKKLNAFFSKESYLRLFIHLSIVQFSCDWAFEHALNQRSIHNLFELCERWIFFSLLSIADHKNILLWISGICPCDSHQDKAPMVWDMAGESRWWRKSCCGVIFFSLNAFILGKSPNFAAYSHRLKNYEEIFCISIGGVFVTSGVLLLLRQDGCR